MVNEQFSFEDRRKAVVVHYDIELDDAGLDPYAFRAYQRIARRTAGSRSGKCTEKQRQMAQGCQMSRDKLIESLEKLEDWNMIERHKEPGKAGHYALLDKSGWIIGGKIALQKAAEVSPTPTTPVAHTDNTCRPHRQHLSPTPTTPVGIGDTPYKEEEDKEDKRKRAANSKAANGTTAASNGQFSDWTEEHFSEHLPETIVAYCEATKRGKDNLRGLARMLWRTGGEDYDVWHWLEQQQAPDEQEERTRRQRAMTIFEAEEQAHARVKLLLATDTAEFDRLTADIRARHAAHIAGLSEQQQLFWDESTTVGKENWQGALRSRLAEEFAQEILNGAN